MAGLQETLTGNATVKYRYKFRVCDPLTMD